ncbi:MAG: HK97 family phage prohead protease [Bacteroidales bacterium]|nr:HK97 family phage prohead protease [Bacteroidales bacterium]
MKLPFICGYAAVFARTGDAFERFGTVGYPQAEIVLPSAFDVSLARGADVAARVNHDPSNSLGSLRGGQLRLRKTKHGLWYVIDPPDTRIGRDTVDRIEAGELTGSSFQFRGRIGGIEYRPDLTDFDDDKGETVQILRSVELVDVGPVDCPAYPRATVELRHRR